MDVDAYLHGIVRARLGVWDWNLVSGECGYSASWFEMLGYAPGEPILVCIEIIEVHEVALATWRVHLRLFTVGPEHPCFI
ncbi:hypothetical protein C4375_00810 [Devosia sp. I507]|nr:hypothetical protein C4375_00810 [Devosia sp. I507]